MKKRNLLIFLAVTGLLTACGGYSSVTSSNGNTSSATSGVNAEIGEIFINGAKTVSIGKTIKLLVSVDGDSTNSVTWSSSDETKATVSSEGVVTGIAAGNVTIKATSTIDETAFGTWEIEVVEETNKPTSITLSIKENEHVTFDNDKNLYVIDVGATFNLEYALNVPNPVPAQEIYFRVAEDSSQQIAYSSFIDIDRKTGECSAIAAFSANTGLSYFSLQVVYSLSVQEQIIGTINVDIVDEKVNDINKVSQALEASLEAEKTKMTKATIERTISTNNNLSSKANYEFFGNGSYVTYEANNSQTKYFNGNKDGNYYNIQFAPSVDVISKSSQNLSTDNHLLGYDYDLKTYGLISNVQNLISSSTSYYSIFTFNNDVVRPYITLSQSGNVLTLSVDSYIENHGDLNAVLTLNFNNNNLLTSYSYQASLDFSITNEGGTVNNNHYVINEKGTFTYADNKVANDGNYQGKLDLGSYYIKQDFEIKNLEGTTAEDGSYNFVNSDNFERYISQEYLPSTSEYQGKNYDVYEMSPDQSFAFGIDETTVGNSNVNLDVDFVKTSMTPISSQNFGEDAPDEIAEPVCSVTTLDNGVFSISNRFDNLGNAVKGDTLVTLTSTNGYTNSFIVRYTDYPDPEEIIVDAPNITLDEGEYYFEDVAVGDISTTFLLNTVPDTMLVDYDLEVYDQTGKLVEDALELYEYQDGNPDEKTGFGIKGLKTGEYNFRIYVVGHEDVKSTLMHIEIIPQLTNEEVLEGITGDEGYDYPGLSTVDVNFKFTKDYKLIITQNMVGSVYTDTLTYHIENGKVMIDGGQENVLDYDYGGSPIHVPGKYIILGNNLTSGSASNPYVRYIRTDAPMAVSRDFKTIRAYTGGIDDAYTSAVDLEKVKSVEDINICDYVFTANVYVQDLGGQCTVKLEFFENNTGSYTLIAPNGQTYPASTFTYTMTQHSSYGYNEYSISSFAVGNGEFAINAVNLNYFDFYYADNSLRTNSSANITVVDSSGAIKMTVFASFIASEK